MFAPWKKTYDKPRQNIKKQRHYFPDKGPLVNTVVFRVVMYGCESWTITKAEHRRIDAFELWCWKRLLRVLDCKEIKPVNSKGNQSWIFIGSTDTKAEAPILQPSGAKSWLTRKDHDAGKDCKQKEKGMTEDEMVGWPHWLNAWVWASSRR